jgi:hypothetical protein
VLKTMSLIYWPSLIKYKFQKKNNFFCKIDKKESCKSKQSTETIFKVKCITVDWLFCFFSMSAFICGHMLNSEQQRSNLKSDFIKMYFDEIRVSVTAFLLFVPFRIYIMFIVSMDVPMRCVTRMGKFLP